MRFLLLLIFFICQLSAETLIHTSVYIDGVSDKSKTNSTIIVEDGKIKSISKGYLNPAGYEYIDLKSYTVMPGLMDMHVHFGGEYQSKARPGDDEIRYFACE